MRYLKLDSMKIILCIKKQNKTNFLIDRLHTIRYNSFQGSISVMVNSLSIILHIEQLVHPHKKYIKALCQSENVNTSVKKSSPHLLFFLL